LKSLRGWKFQDLQEIYDRVLAVADGMLGFNMKWTPDSATQSSYVSLIQLASATRCVLVGTSFYDVIEEEDNELLDLPGSLWDMLVDDRFTYVTWNQAVLRWKFNQSFGLDFNSIKMIDVEARPLLARNTNNACGPCT
jgi:hypothetical protein